MPLATAGMGSEMLAYLAPEDHSNASTTAKTI